MLDRDITKVASVCVDGEVIEFPEEIQWAYKHKKFMDEPPKYSCFSYPWRWRKPVGDTEDWRCSIYYYWWEYLRRNERYQMICNAYAYTDRALIDGFTEIERRTYRDFGDVFSLSFHQWWGSHYTLFIEKEAVFATTENGSDDQPEIGNAEFWGRISSLRLKKIFDATVSDLFWIDQIRIHYRREDAMYRACGRYVLPTLQAHLDVWDAKIANPSLKDHEIADLAKVKVGHGYDEEEVFRMKADGMGVADLERTIRRAKQLAVQRHLRIARQYIDNVLQGRFPLRNKR